MELKDLLKMLKKHKESLFVWYLVGATVALAIYFLPTRYLATGSFYVTRATDTNTGFFTYEGYYSQQVALSYANTVAGLLESVDIQSKALTDLSIPVNENTLRNFARHVSVKKNGPQLISLTVKGNSYESAQKAWQAISQELISATKDINTNGDSKLSIAKISELPVVSKTYKSLWIDITAGIIVGMLLGTFFIALKEYD